jgi:SP family myo-inositol transporter-like MFS transporter 13
MSPRLYTALLLFISGMGGLLYGYDIGIIGAALLYLGKTIHLTLAQESLIVAAVLGGGTISSLVAGALADVLGRKKLMIAAALLFIASVVLIVIAKGFGPLFAGRALQGLSAGMIAVVIPLYLAECLPARIRGRGTAVFQLMLTTGILISLAVGAYFAREVDTLSARSTLDAAALLAAQDKAWRAMFLSAMYPAIVFLLGSVFVTESPRWLLRRGRTADSRRALERSRAPSELEAEFARMTASNDSATEGAKSGPLWQRRYIVPFLLACTVLGLTQATGINSILQFIVVILQQAGLDATTAAEKATLVTAVNVAFTVVGLLLVDKLGRKALLMIGTAGIAIALITAAIIFHRFESDRLDVTEIVGARVAENSLSMRVEEAARSPTSLSVPTQLTVLYAQGDDERLITGFSRATDPVVKIPADTQGRPLTIKRAHFGAVPPESTGTWVMLCLMLFIASFAIGPGVCVWLALSELMPTRIRSLGMGLGLLINQGVSTLIAAVFLPIVGNHGYTSIFIFWAICTVLYFAVAAFWLPETKGRTLEEIEAHFAN